MGAGALEAARKLAAGRDARKIAEACAVDFVGDGESGRFVVPFLGSDVLISYPDLAAEQAGAVPPHVEALLVYYLGTCDGAPLEDRWVSFAELPDGAIYVQAFRGYTTQTIVRRFGEDRASLESALAKMGATPLPRTADAAWVIPALPKVPVALLWWEGDDEFPPRAELLFDASAPHHLPTDGYAVLGSWLTAMLQRLAG